MEFIEATSIWKSICGTRLTLIAERGKGMVQIDFVTDHPRLGSTALIWDLFVREDCRRQGIAKALMQEAFKRAKDLGYKTATLEWDERETPVEIARWYVSLGFDEKRIGKGYLLMEKQL